MDPRRKTVQQDPRDHKVSMGGFITMPIQAVKLGLIAEIENDSDKLRFVDFARRLEALYSLNTNMKFAPLRRSFDIFSPRNTATTFADSDLNVVSEEDEFIERLHNAMMASNMELLSKEEQLDSVNSDYILNLDMALQEDLLDNSFIARLHKRHAKEQIFKDAAQVTKHVLVYHRGIGQTSCEGLFIVEKIDIIIGWVFDFAVSIVVYLLGMLQFWQYAKQIGNIMDGFDGEEEDDEDDDDDLLYQSPVKEMTVKRLSLENALRENWMNILFSVELFEPTFREIILVYRLDKDVHADHEMPSPIQVKSFKDIPISDFEVVLPAQRPVTRAMDLLKMIMMIITAAITLLREFFTQLTPDTIDLTNSTNATLNGSVYNMSDGNGSAFMQDGIANNTFPNATVLPSPENVKKAVDGGMSVLAIVATYAVKMVMNWKAQQTRYQNLITATLYNKFMDSDHGVRAFLVDATFEQDYKEALLAYFFVWQGRAQSIEELDDECEKFLAKAGDIVDFEVDDAVAKLTRDGLLQLHGPLAPSTRVTAISIRRAQKKLDEIWMAAFETRDIECPFCPLLDSDVCESHDMVSKMADGIKALGKRVTNA
eukprot:m.27687 g.27687  ORF g.27687 m.27687 type:complete len:597 (-) comp7921_c0_seq2:155-1945(-)